MKSMLSMKKASVLVLFSLLCLLLLAGCGGVKIGNQTVDADATAVSVTDASFDDYAVLKKLTKLSELDLRALSLSVGQYEQIASQVADDVRIFWNVPLGEEQYPNTSQSLQLSSSQLSQAVEVLPYFTDLKTVTIEPCDLSEELCRAVEAVRGQFPDAQVHAGSQIGGVTFDDETEKVVLNKIKLADSDVIRLAIRAFPNIKTYEMCECGLSDDVMGKLREDYPEITFIWVVKFDRFSVRTDAVVFSSLEYDVYRNITEETFQPLFRYCTELRALDIGHHGIKDISGLANLKKLQALILTDNYISDISPLAQLPELRYIEINWNDIADVTPFTQIENIENISMSSNHHLKNILNLTNCKNLKSLYLFGTNVKGKELDALIKGLPEGCIFQYDFNRHHNIRSERRGRKVKEAFWDWEKVESFDFDTDSVYTMKK